jgi:DNA-binding response OmpR family regulator
MDVMLPSLDGISLLKHLRAKPAWKDVPVLMMTAKSQEEDVLRAIDAGASDYVVKPFDPTELIMRIRRLVGRK